MSQTSTERLRDYLVQLPPQSQALLMREFERAIERGEDASVANFVLEQLRKVVRGSDDEAQPRTNERHRRQLRARTVAQGGARKRRRGAAAHQRSGTPAIPSA